MSLRLPQNDYSRTIVTVMKDEAPYMLDWMAYHLAIGFTHFVILTNDCSDGTDKIARKLENHGLVTHKNNKAPHPKGPQKTGYQRMRNLEAVQHAGWLMALDVDEFLRIDVGDGTLDGLFETVTDEVKAVSFVWQLYGNNNVRELIDAPVWEQFTRSQLPLQARPYECTSIKTLYQAKYFERIGTHRPVDLVEEEAADFLWIDADGIELKPYYRLRHWRAYENGFGYGTILGRVNHYALRSLDGFMVKWRRGFVHPNAPTVRGQGKPEDYWVMFNWNLYDAEPLRQTERALEYKAAILAVDDVAKHAANGFEWHLERAAQLRQDEAETYERLADLQGSEITDPMPDFSHHGSPPTLAQPFVNPNILLQKGLKWGRFEPSVYLSRYSERPSS